MLLYWLLCSLNMVPLFTLFLDYFVLLLSVINEKALELLCLLSFLAFFLICVTWVSQLLRSSILCFICWLFGFLFISSDTEEFLFHACLLFRLECCFILETWNIVLFSVCFGSYHCFLVVVTSCLDFLHIKMVMLCSDICSQISLFFHLSIFQPISYIFGPWLGSLNSCCLYAAPANHLDFTYLIQIFGLMKNDSQYMACDHAYKLAFTRDIAVTWDCLSPCFIYE